jgi:hypothetical protein
MIGGVDTGVERIHTGPFRITYRIVAKDITTCDLTRGIVFSKNNTGTSGGELAALEKIGCKEGMSSN